MFDEKLSYLNIADLGCHGNSSTSIAEISSISIDFFVTTAPLKGPLDVGQPL
jgi:hypothetical protein